MLENENNKEKNQYGFYNEDYYNEEFDEYGFNKAGILLKKGYSEILGDANIENYHKYGQFCSIKKHPDYILVKLAYYASDTVKKTMLRYGWKYHPDCRVWVNKTPNVDFARFVNFLKYNARNQTFISLEQNSEIFRVIPPGQTEFYDLLGYDKEGYNRTGFNRLGKNRGGYNKDGFNDEGYNIRGENRIDFTCRLIKEATLNMYRISHYIYGDVLEDELFSYKTKEPNPNGIFSEDIFGNIDELKASEHFGINYRSKNKLSGTDYRRLTRFGSFELCRKVINPWFANVLRILTGLREDIFLDIIYYKKYLVLDPGNLDLEKNSVISYERFKNIQTWNENYDIRTGAEAIYEMVVNLDFRQILSELENERKTATEFHSNKIKDRIKIIRACLTEVGAIGNCFIEKLLVIPIDLRPYTMLEDGRFSYSDINDLYKNVIRKNKFVLTKERQGWPSGYIEGAYVELQEAIDALFDNSNCSNPVINEYTLEPCTSLKEIFFNKNGLFMDLLEGCETAPENVSLIKDDFIIEDNELYLYLGNDEKVVVPESITKIRRRAFSNCMGLRFVEIPKSVEEIASFAFECCENLEFITGAEGVTTIGVAAFTHCKKLRNIITKENVEIHDFAFDKCDSLSDKDGFVIINDILFHYSGNDINVNIPFGVKGISGGAFRSCDNIKSITLSDDVKRIGGGSFEDCKNLETIYLPDSIDTIDFKAFISCESLKCIKIPNSLTSISQATFSGCKELKKIVIPSNVTSIAFDAFLGCDNLTIYTTQGSFAESYAKQKGIPVILE